MGITPIPLRNFIVFSRFSYCPTIMAVRIDFIKGQAWKAQKFDL